MVNRVSWDPQYFNGSVPRPPSIDWNGSGQYLHPEAAWQLRGFAAEFERVWGVPFTTSEASRDLATQDYFWDLFQSGNGFPAAPRGTSSHGEDVAVDIHSWVYGNSQNTERHRWIRENGPAWGWDWYYIGAPSGEPWHINYRFGMRTIVVPTTPQEVDDMYDAEAKALALKTYRAALAGGMTLFRSRGGAIYAGAPGFWGQVPSMWHLDIGNLRGIWDKDRMQQIDSDAELGFWRDFFLTQEANDNSAVKLLEKLPEAAAKKVLEGLK